MKNSFIVFDDYDSMLTRPVLKSPENTYDSQYVLLLRSGFR